MAFIFEHSSLGFCWWDLLALIALILVIVIFVIKHQKTKNEIKRLEEETAGLYAADTLNDALPKG